MHKSFIIEVRQSSKYDFLTLPLTCTTLKKAIQKLKNNRSSGKDEINIKLIKTDLTEYIDEITNKSLKELQNPEKQIFAIKTLTYFITNFYH